MPVTTWPLPFVPSLILGEAHPQAMRRPGDIAGSIRDALPIGFFRRFELPAWLDPQEGTELAEMRRATDIRFTCWASEAIAGDSLHLCACSESERRRAVDQLRRVAERAAAYGADRMGVITGPDPGEVRRHEAAAQLIRSLVELGGALARDFGMQVILEPLDRGAHKNGFMGPTDEAVAVVTRARQETPAVFLGWDSGHAVLNGEDPAQSLRNAAEISGQIHLSNPVIDRTSKLYGDHHYPIGSVGVGTVGQFGRVIRAASVTSFPESTSIAVEVRTQGTLTPTDTIRHCEDILREVAQTAAEAAGIT